MLAFSEGRLTLSNILSNDKNGHFKSVFSDGVEFTILPFSVEQIFGHEIADLAQSALNADHGTYSQANELQVMASMAMAAAATNGDVDWKHVVHQAKGALPRCQDYLDTLANFVKYYAGGESAPIVMFLDGWSKAYGKNKILGEGFWDAVVNARFQSGVTQFPFLRAALVATNLVSPQKKISDGVARLVTKTDVSALTSTAKLLHITSAETLMSTTWKQLQTLQQEGQLLQRTADDLFGKLITRTCLFLVKKGKEGPESQEYTSLKDVKAKFDKELGQAGGADDYSGAPDVDEAGTAPQASLEDVSDPVWIATSNGFVIGRVYLEKGKNGNPHKLIGMDAAAGCTFQEISSDRATPATKTEGFDRLKANWIEFRGKIQMKVEGHDTHMVHNMPSVEAEIARCKAWAALADLARTWSAQESSSISFFRDPDEIRMATGVALAIGKLKLVPFTQYKNLSDKPTHSGFKIELASGKHVYLEAPPKPRGSQPEWRNDTVWVGFWWVKGVSKQSEANMEMTTVSVGGMSVPVLQNFRDLKPFDVLSVFEGRGKKKQRTA